MASINIAVPSGAGWTGYERRHFRVSWGAVIAGLAVATAVHVALTVLGVAIGAGAWDRGDQLKSLGIAAMTWTIASMLVAVFIGGMTTARMSGHALRRDRVLHGVVLWSLTTVLMLWTVSTGLGGVVGSTFGFLGETAATAAQGAAQSVTEGVAANQSLETIGERAQQSLERQGVSSDSIRAAAEQIGRDVARNQEQISGAVSSGAWATLVMMAVSLFAAVSGAAVGSRRTRRGEAVVVET